MRVVLPHAAESHKHPEMVFVRKYIFSTDHKIIGIQFLFSTLIFLAIGGILALMVRMQLGWPHGELPIFRDIFQTSNGGRMSPEFYNMLFSMHASVMIFFVIIPMLAGARRPPVPPADDRLLLVHPRPLAGVRPAVPDRGADPAIAGQDRRHHVLPAARGAGVRQLDDGARRRAGPPVAAPVLVLLAPG